MRHIGNRRITANGAASHNDHLGSASVTMTSAGAVAQTQEYDPWGKVRSGGITATDINFPLGHADCIIEPLELVVGNSDAVRL